jgi:opacity protein-like surface antigen
LVDKNKLRETYQPKGNYMKRLILGAMVALISTAAMAGDINSPALKAFANPYTLTACGAYFGINTFGSANSVQSSTVAPGTQVVQGALGGTVGYGCPINASSGSFWFAEGMFDVANINGATSGISFTNAPVSFTQRFGAGTPLQSMLGSLLPAGTNTSAAVPNLPLLPNGITAGPGAPYGFIALHEDDVSAQVGLMQNKQWLISWGVGAGIRYRLSNAVIADTFAEYKTPTSLVCVGPLGSAGCAKIGQGARVGVQFLY